MSKSQSPGLPKPFIHWYESLHWEQKNLIENALHDVLRAVEENTQPASLTLVLKVQPKGKRKVVIAPSVTTKLPRPKLEASSAWLTPTGDLSESDPQQPDLPLTVVEASKPPLSIVNKP